MESRFSASAGDPVADSWGTLIGNRLSAKWPMPGTPLRGWRLCPRSFSEARGRRNFPSGRQENSMNKRALLLTSAIFFSTAICLLVAASVNAQSLSGTVVGIADGDTISVRIGAVAPGL